MSPAFITCQSHSIRLLVSHRELIGIIYSIPNFYLVPDVLTIILYIHVYRVVVDKEKRVVINMCGGGKLFGVFFLKYIKNTYWKVLLVST